MSPNQPGASRYWEVEVKTANPVQLVIMLYDGAIGAVKEAQQHVLADNVAGRARCTNRALAIISELQATLNFRDGGTVAVSLDRLYSYMKQLVLRGSLENACAPLLEVAGLLETLRPAWCAVAIQTQGSLPVSSAQADTGVLETQLMGINLSG